ncbi:NADP-dependent oxidoreductase [Chitinophaga sp. LS1]|uniref:NADP-dependent oxidoreductase n=1 Tax=Chitinophaga sp. LS1 TaxID=3051176 RepID=UPI002AAB5846|nr:NADP-dependent oxidoreductase [Chitinophaga sp. LS1]WPV69850.1 NADP-dependent oxidoreductase [Chitinophaga sp. LS1]
MSNLMRAALLREFGPASNLTIERIPVPLPAAGQLLIKVRAAGINPVDYKTRNGKGIAAKELVLPAVLGWDIAGEVVSLGDGVSRFDRNERVFGMSNFPHAGNAYAEYAIVQEDEFALIPASVSNEVAAATPLAALTAWEALFDHGQLAGGQKVLIHAAAGGVGHIAVQLAKWKGAYVVGTASQQNHGLLNELGVDLPLDYNTQDFTVIAKDMDVVLDGIGGENSLRSIDVLNPGGVLVCLPSMYKDDPVILEKAASKGVMVKWMMVTPSGERMEQLADLLAVGDLKVKVDQTFPLEDVGKAHEAVETGHVTGKVVLVI